MVKSAALPYHLSLAATGFVAIAIDFRKKARTVHYQVFYVGVVLVKVRIIISVLRTDLTLFRTVTNA